MSVDFELGYSRPLVEACRQWGLLRNQCAYLMATAYWETAGTVMPVREAYWLSEEWRENNLWYYPWYGRGFVQLSLEENYARADAELDLGGALIADLDLALNPEIAARVIIVGMYVGWFTGRSLPEFITLERSDYLGARAIVNGSDRAAEIAEIAVAYDEALLAEGYGVEDPEPDRPDWPLVVSNLRAVLNQLAAARAEERARLDRLEKWAASFGDQF